MEKRSAGKPLDCAQIAWDRVHEGEGASRMYRVLLKWVRFASGEYRETAGTALVFAVAAKLGRFDPDLAGMRREEAADMAISAIRYLGFTHDTGPEECVRVQSANPACSGTKWGGRRDPYFQATQAGVALNQFGLAAWLLWSELDEETRSLVRAVVFSYADRWSTVAPRPGVYVDTQCEENAWTALGIATAAYMFPEDERAAGWREGVKAWALGAVNTFRDRIALGSSAPVTFHPDWTAENHAFVHPTYMAAGINLRSSTALLAMMRGEPAPEEVVRHNVDLYEHTLLPWAHTDGMSIPVQGQSWWYNRQHEALHTHCAMAALHGHEAAGKLALESLDAIERLQDSNARGCLLEENGEALWIVKKDFQTAKDMEHNAVVSFVKAYLLSAFGGVELDASTAWTPWRGVREYPHGGIIVHKTERAFSSFSWRNNVMALTVPERGLWDVTPLFASYTGTFVVSDAAPNGAEPAPGTFLRDEQVVEAERCRVTGYANGFGAVAGLRRSGGRLLQEVAFVSLPDGRSLYAERVEATRSCFLAEHLTGLIGVRNERYAAMPERARGEKVVTTAAESVRFEGYYGRDPDRTHRFGATPWVNLDGRIGYVLFGTEDVTYVNRHEYAKWKGIEDLLALNDRSPRRFDAGERLAPFIALTLPNADVEETKRQADASRLWATSGDDAILVETGTELVYVNFAGTSVLAEGTTTVADRRFPIYEGACEWDAASGALRWRGALPMRQSGFLPRLGEVEVPETALSGTIDIVAAAGSLVVRRRGPAVAVTIRLGAGREAAALLADGESIVLHGAVDVTRTEATA